MGNQPRTLVERVYPALAGGDRDTLLEVLHPDFEGNFSPGLPAPIGGPHAGALACINEGWWAIGAVWAIRAQPERWLEIGADQLLVLGTYTGKARRTGRAVVAPFAHVWAADGDRLRSLHQYTDTLLWCAALDAEATR
jgi:ketosteroid isomerase-like protein